LFTRSCDAIVIGPGRIGTFHEFTIAFEDQKPIGILKGEGEWETDEILMTMIQKSHRPHNNIIFEDDPKILVAKLLKMVHENNKHLRGYKNYDGVSSGKDGMVL
jgi:predicted Rossmann-fold nucleotide-binding protein